ncbi:MAG: RDD family protein [Bacteroidetes bacterium]|nr:RDD family protein [Bacteroidota bacterium]
MTDIQIKYRTGIRRFVAAIVDGMIFIPLAFIDSFTRLHFLNNEFILLLWVALVTALPICYSVLMHFKYGQTLGKMLADVKVVSLSETTNLSFKQALLRDSFYIIVELFALIYFSLHLIQVQEVLPKMQLLDEFDNFGSSVAGVWVLLELISMLANNKRRAIHDFIAGSVVIKREYVTQTI